MREYLRKAAGEDLDLLFAWANDGEVRKHSFSTAPISYEEHTRWFSRLLEDSAARQYIYMVDQVPVGQIRVTVKGDQAEIGYSICAEYRGRGHGKKMLALLPGRLKEDAPGVRTLTARVKEGNLASEQAFLRSGYRKAYTAFALKLGE